jgi:ABC-type uncharacterized transport system auxiliary subunit
MKLDFPRFRGQICKSAPIGVFLLLTACAGAPLPDYHYYRLNVTAPAAKENSGPVPGLVLVDAPRAPAVYVPRAIAYSGDTGQPSLEHYHYHAWIDPPARLLQQELVRYLQAARFGSAVVTDAGRAPPDYRVSGEIRRFERVKTANGWAAAVALELRADSAPDAPPLLVRGYEKTVPAGDATLEATVEAFSSASAAIFQAFTADLTRAVQARSPARAHD